MKLNSYNWPAYSRAVSFPSDPTEFCEAAMERFMDRIRGHVVSVSNVRYQFKGINKIKLIDFDNEASAERYEQAYLRYLEAIGKVKDDDHGGGFALLVEWLKFRQAAELERAHWFARNMVNGVTEGYASVCAVNFMATIAKVVKVLVEEHNVPRDQISLIWGGSKTFSGTEKFLTTDEIHELLARCMRGEKVEAGVLRDVRKQVLATQAGLGQLDAALRLGVQSAEDRQNEIIKFQSGKSLFCLYTYKSGGVGLSLHHTDEYTERKVRRKKESNYAVEEDIPLIPTRPRLAFVAPTYSAIELVQGLGRCARITSLSDTLQTLVFFKGTIEQSVAHVTSRKLKVLKKVVKKNETWAGMIMDGTMEREEKQLVNEELIDHENVSENDSDEEGEED